jgi:parvulin-like peptidyl-prolyl isomerase
VALLLLCALGLVAPAPAQDAPDPDANVANRIVLRVNDQIATLYDYRRRLAAFQEEIGASESLGPAERLQTLADAPRQVVRAIFDELLLLSRARQLRMTVAPEQIDAAIADLRQQRGLPDDNALRILLSRFGMTVEDYRRQVESELLLRQVRSRELLPRIDVPEDRLREAYQENLDVFAIPERRSFRELVVLETAQLSEDQKRSLARGLREAWIEGSDPKLLAEERADSVRYLELEPVTREDLAANLAEAVFTLEPGVISEPIEARGGIHVLRVEEIELASVRPYEEVRDRILAHERGLREQDELRRYLDELEARAYVEDYLPPELSDFRTASGRLVEEGGRVYLRASGLELDPAPAEAAEDPEGNERAEPENER